jgi:hypothetical protein
MSRQTKQEFDSDELGKVFPQEMPDNLILTDSYGDAVTETAPFAGLRWSDVTWQTIKEHFEAPFFFSAAAFAYFLPAYIAQSQSSLPIITLAVENCLTVLSESPEEKIEKWRRLRWSKFNAKQLQVINRWTSWLQSIEANLDCLDSARENVSKLLSDPTMTAPCA